VRFKQVKLRMGELILKFLRPTLETSEIDLYEYKIVLEFSVVANLKL
jgi:hypothetical protein